MKSKGDNSSNFRYYFSQIWNSDKRLFLCFIAYTVLTSILPFIGIFAPKLIIQEYLGLRRAEVFVYIIGTLLIISAFGYYISSYLNAITLNKLLKIKQNLCTRIQEKCMKMDFKHTEDRDVLNAYSKADYAVGSTGRGIIAIYIKVFDLVGRIFAFGGYIAIVLTLNPFVLLYLIANVIIIYLITLKVKKYQFSKLSEITDVNRKKEYIYQTMSDFAYGKDIRIYKVKNWLIEKYHNMLNKSISINKSIENKKFCLSLIDIILILFREGIVYVYLIYRVVYIKDMPIDNFIMYFTTISGFALWMQKIMDDIAYIKEQNMYVSNYINFMNIDKDDEKVTYQPVPTQEPYNIEFKNVSFKYPNSDRYIYKDLSLKINSGQRLAIVGVNGAGKTTFVKLLCRLYEPNEGEILLNGINIKKFNKEEYYKLFSPVFQEIKMFAFSVADNVALETGDRVDREKVVESIDRADMKEKIDTLKYGIDTKLYKIFDKDGVELSGGENQKLALARALYKDGKIIILDEPTAALDAISEYKTYLRFNDFVGNKTAIYVSHRLASTRFCDVIAFFENGKIAEYGTHDELLKKDGRYKNMFDVQACYYRENTNENEENEESEKNNKNRQKDNMEVIENIAKEEA